MVQWIGTARFDDYYIAIFGGLFDENYFNQQFHDNLLNEQNHNKDL